MPWFDCPHRKTANTCIAFGHWSTLGLHNQKNLIALDTGCVWGGALTALEISMADFDQRQIHQLPCPPAQTPGK
jgi:bis(5'-nucleosyl)-tetraphosphatase (symmetrical)